MIDARKIIDSLFKAIVKLCGDNSKRSNYILKSVCKAIENNSYEFMAFNCRPKLSNMVVIDREVSEDIKEKCAIILQGPILKEDNFTVETAKLYKNMYLGHSIIVSTWENEDEHIIKELRDNNIEVVLNKQPKTSGLGNINYQVLSTIGGIKRAKELNCRYILKTRTDQRIYIPDFLNYFLSLLDLYPVVDKKEKAKKRIVTVSGIVGATVFIPYMLSDFLYFGTTHDISNIFNLKEDPLSMSREERVSFIDDMINKISIAEFYNKTAPESRIIKEYIDKYTDIDADDSVESYWKFIRNYTITLGMKDIDLYWRKYNIYEESQVMNIYRRDDSIEKKYKYVWNFENWLMLYAGRLKYKQEFEEYKNKIMMI